MSEPWSDSVRPCAGRRPGGPRPESLESLRQGLDEFRQPAGDHAAGEERGLLGDVLAGLGVTHRAHQVHDLRDVRCLKGEHPLVIAQAVGVDHQESELPPMRNRWTMARRVRGYVLSGKHRTGAGTTLGGMKAQPRASAFLSPCGDVRLRRKDRASATVKIGDAYLASHGRLGYAATCHAAHGPTVDVARVVAAAECLNRAGSSGVLRVWSKCSALVHPRSSRR